MPTAATGNSLSLATFGGAGEIMAFFYPHLDYAQNVREGMLAVHLHDWGRDAFLWCFADCFERSQYFKPHTNILVTSLRHRDCDLTIETTDLLPPGEHALVRRIAVIRGPDAPRLTLMHYFNLSLGDVDRRNAVHYLPERRAIVQQFREVTLALAADRGFGLHTGTVQPDGGSATKEAMSHGHLAGPDQCMGNVDFAIALAAEDQPRWELMLVLAGAAQRSQAGADARRLADIPFEQHERQAVERCRSILSRATLQRPPDLSDAYNRAVLVLHDLFDRQAGTFIAAPEFDPHYAYSGGYGYCWPRDAAVSALTCASIGFPDMAEAFFDWCIKSQLDDGHWFQRYWTNRTEAPSWCVRENEIQLDQTCAVLHAASLFADRTSRGLVAADLRVGRPGVRPLHVRDSSDFVRRFAASARRAAEAIIRHVGEDGLHRRSADLWEGSWGSFAYTQAAVIAALRDGQRVFDTPTADLERLKRVLIERFWSPQRRCWAKMIDGEGKVDGTLDSSCLGLIEPWNVLDLADAGARQMAVQTIETLSERLSVDVAGGRALLRFENESYMGGGPGCVNTLWAALCRLRLAAVQQGDARQRQIDAARALVATALANTNPTGQLPELIPNRDAAYWAAPHGWASSLLIECVLALGALEAG